MNREGKAVVWGGFTGLALAALLVLFFGVLDVQCRGTGKPNWDAQLQLCE